MSFYDAIRVGASGAADFEVERSLRFNDDDNGYLTRTPSSASNRKTWTYSFWWKIGNPSGQQVFFSVNGNSNSTYFDVTYKQDETIAIGLYTNSLLKTNRVFRDITAWHHMVFAFDSTQATGTNRLKFYVNGIEQTSFSSDNRASLITQDGDFAMNSTGQLAIGRDNTNIGKYVDGYMAEINHIDGQQLTPASFGETDAITGQWNPKKYAGSYGTNGFYLKFSDNSGTTATTLGKDSSGNGNNFTPNNFSVSTGAGNDSVTDTPTNNFCTMNPLDMHSSMSTKNGNLQVGEGNDWRGIKGTFGVSSGKWYYEFKTGNANIFCGWAADDLTGTNNISTNPQDSNSAMSRGVLIFCDDGKYQLDTGGSGTRINYSSALAVNDVLGCAIDLDNNTAQFYKQGTALGSINISSSKLATKKVMPYFICHPFSDPDYTFNFGQQAFAYTPPTGYKALCSANLPDPTILLPNKHFDTVLYSGDGNATQTLSDVLQFQPDWFWLKGRNTNYSHLLYDAVRGAGLEKGLNSNQTRAEGSAVGDNSTYGYLNSFDSNGFTVTKGSDSTSYTNGSSSNYVAWNWNAGDTDGKTYTVKVVSDSGNKYRFDNFGTSAVTLDLAEGGTYIFNMDDATNASHPFSIGTAANGTVYTSGITYFLDGVSKTYSQYTSGFSSATTRRLHITVPASAPVLYYWCSAHSGMGGQINTNTTLGSSNFDGAIQSVVKVNASAGFSINTYTGTGSSTTVGHGLGVKPDWIIIKRRDAVDNWMVYHAQLNSGVDPEDYYSELNSNSSSVNSTAMLNDTAPTSSVVTIGSDNSVNGSSATYVMYCFSGVTGYSKFGLYEGNGSADGTFVFTGFRPAFILYTEINDNQGWQIHDYKRLGYNDDNYALRPDSGDAETTNVDIDILSNGFKFRNGLSISNGGGIKYIYIAFAKSPFKNARAR